jgi:anti-anti-sigma regulatory factor
VISVRMDGRTLEVRLPASLVVENRTGLIDAVAANLESGMERVRLDASELVDLDSAGLGALARVLRMAVEATGAPPQLVDASPEVRESMRSVLLLRYFE